MHLDHQRILSGAYRAVTCGELGKVRVDLEPYLSAVTAPGPGADLPSHQDGLRSSRKTMLRPASGPTGLSVVAPLRSLWLILTPAPHTSQARTRQKTGVLFQFPPAGRRYRTKRVAIPRCRPSLERRHTAVTPRLENLAWEIGHDAFGRVADAYVQAGNG